MINLSIKINKKQQVFRLIVQMVERTAHNGLVVGSNPTKPKFKNEFKFKNLQN